MNEEINYINQSVLKMGQNAFAYYNALYRSQDSCKEHLYKPNDSYENCMIEKANCCYEETIRLFNKLEQNKNKVN